jgi:hypothetical protein
MRRRHEIAAPPSSGSYEGSGRFRPVASQ